LPRQIRALAERRGITEEEAAPLYVACAAIGLANACGARLQECSDSQRRDFLSLTVAIARA
jgi:hypothetical protein